MNTARHSNMIMYRCYGNRLLPCYLIVVMVTNRCQRIYTKSSGSFDGSRVRRIRLLFSSYSIWLVFVMPPSKQNDSNKLYQTRIPSFFHYNNIGKRIVINRVIIFPFKLRRTIAHTEFYPIGKLRIHVHPYNVFVERFGRERGVEGGGLMVAWRSFDRAQN